MAEQKLVGQNYTVPDLVAKVTGKSKYAEDFRAEGMIFAKLLLSPLPHARVTRLDLSAALAMPGVKAILTADDLPKPADSINDNGQVILANLDGEVALTNEPVYQGQPILAVAAVDEVTAADAIEKIQIEFEPLPFVVDPLVSLRPGGPNARTKGNYWFIPPPAPPAPAGQGQAQNPPRPEIRELKWTEAELAEAKDRPPADDGGRAREVVVRRPRGGLQECRARARRDVRHARHQPPDAGDPDRDGVLAERQGATSTPARRAPPRPSSASPDGSASLPKTSSSSASTPVAGSAARSPARFR